MEYLYIGKIIGTHALKGEIRIISDFEYKDSVFKTNNEIYIGNEKEKCIIISYRIHKKYDMVKLNGFNDILEVKKFINKDVYVNKNSLNLEGKILDNDLINLEAIYLNNKIGNIKEIINNNGYKVISLGKNLIPYNKNFIEKIDIEEKRIYFKNIDDLI